MTRKDFVALAAILAEHRAALQETDNANVKKFGSSVKTNALNFSRLMSDVRKYCKERNPNFSTATFDATVFGNVSDD